MWVDPQNEKSSWSGLLKQYIRILFKINSVEKNIEYAY